MASCFHPVERCHFSVDGLRRRGYAPRSDVGAERGAVAARRASVDAHRAAMVGKRNEVRSRRSAVQGHPVGASVPPVEGERSPVVRRMRAMAGSPASLARNRGPDGGRAAANDRALSLTEPAPVPNGRARWPNERAPRPTVTKSRVPPLHNSARSHAQVASHPLRTADTQPVKPLASHMKLAVRRPRRSRTALSNDASSCWKAPLQSGRSRAGHAV